MMRACLSTHAQTRRTVLHRQGLLLAMTLIALFVPTGCTDSTPAIRTVTIRAFELGFEPSTVTIHRDESVQLIFLNDGILTHDLKVEGIAMQLYQPDKSWVSGEIALQAEPKQQVVIVFTATAPGVYDFVCTAPGHKEAGMRGTLTVR